METKSTEEDLRADQISISETSAEAQIQPINVKKILLAIDKSGYKTKAMNFAVTLAKS